MQSDNERISFKLNVLIEYKSVCSGKSCLPMLLLVFSKHVIIESSRQTKHISVMLQMTPPAHIWVNHKQELGASTAWQLHKIYEQLASTNRTPASCTDCDHKTPIIQRQMHKLLPPTRHAHIDHAHIDVFWRRTHSVVWVNTTLLG